MVEFSICPDFIEYFTRLAAGERIIWHARIDFLLCFSKTFSGDHSRLIMSEYTGVFELGYEFDEAGIWDENQPICIKFLSAPWQLFYSPTLLTRCAPDGSLAVAHLLSDAIDRITKKEVHTFFKRDACVKAVRLVRKEKMVIPPEVMTRMLSVIRRQ